MISGTTTLIAHLGFPTETFKAPLIYNPWFDKRGIDAVVVPMGVRAEDYAEVFRALFRLTNIRGALITMPHKVTTMALVDECSVTARIAGSCNAVLRRPDGILLADMFDGEGFVRGVKRKGFKPDGARCLVVGNGGVGSAIAASLANAGVDELALHDAQAANSRLLAARLKTHYPRITIDVTSSDPAGFDLVVNATPLGMQPDDPLPFDMSKIATKTFVGEVVLKEAMTPLLRAAEQKGCPFVIGTDMLFEQIPAYLKFFGFGLASVDELRVVAHITD
ncbi:MAG: shikimate dehydrogenase [Betaproteobacteria bacterium]|nr:shikimate dehydrogenase [Betaproteobacteria bacterium]